MFLLPFAFNFSFINFQLLQTAIINLQLLQIKTDKDLDPIGELCCVLTTLVKFEPMGKFCVCCQIQVKLCLRVCLLPWNGYGYYDFDQVKGKKDIAENLFALVPEMQCVWKPEILLVASLVLHLPITYFSSPEQSLGWAFVIFECPLLIVHQQL